MAAEPWKPILDLSLRAYWDDDLEAGRLACEWLLAREDLPGPVREQTKKNRIHYAALLGDLAPSAVIAPIQIDVAEGWSRFNPSIAADDDGWLAIVRSSNYVYEDGLYRYPDDDDQVIRTVNYLARFGPDLSIRDVVLLEDRTDQSTLNDFPVTGFEDCRLFRWRGEWRATATVRNRGPRGICQQAMLTIRDGGLEDLILLSDGANGVHEKNWMPMVDGDDLKFVYSIAPTIIERFRPETGRMEVLSETWCPIALADSRGGSQAVRVDGGWLVLVHEGIGVSERQRVYPHRFILIGDDGRVRKVSPLFFFDDATVEFCAGMAERDGVLVASFGSGDREAFVAAMPLAEVLNSLEPPLDLLEYDDSGLFAMAARIGESGAAPEAAAVEPDAAGEAAGPAAPVATPAPPEDYSPAAAALRIASTTITGNSRGIIADALRSVVDWVDICVVIDTGITDDTLEIARSIAGDKLVVRQFTWIQDFAAARNFALEAATDAGAEWAVTLDSDERLDLDGYALRTFLAGTGADLVHLREESGSYAKERFFRLPSGGRFDGPTHEAFTGAQWVETLPSGRFRELGKSEKAYQRKFARDVEILTRHTQEHPEAPRWFYYLGDALQNLHRYEEAVEAYYACWDLDGWNEEGAWAMFRAAECLMIEEDFLGAVDACANGLKRHAGVGELAWLAGLASHKAGNYLEAVCWARMSIALGCVEGVGDRIQRVGFTQPHARYEGPYDVLRYAERALGNDVEADRAEEMHARARELRRERGLV